MSAVVAMRPPTSTWAPRPKKTPFGLTIQTLPLACSTPSICEALPPVTRLSEIEPAPGIRKMRLDPPGTDRLPN